MYYSSIGFLALIIHLIINFDILRNKKDYDIIPSFHQYRSYLFNVLVYYIADLCWGLLYDNGLIKLTFIDTAIYFFAMAGSIQTWIRYVVSYMKQDNFFGKTLKIIGWIFFIFEMVLIVANFFTPILYYFDEAGTYHALTGRYITLGVHVVLFLITSIYAFVLSTINEGAMSNRYLSIGLFSMTMCGFAIGQVAYPLLPVYAIGCLLGGCLIHNFVLENEKEEYRGSLEQKLREGALQGNYYDTLTGLQGMGHFFMVATEDRKLMMERGETPAFMFLDLNGLKFYNERNSFKKGDALIQKLAELLIEEFMAERCSRLGSDKFAAYAPAEGLEERVQRFLDKWEKLDIKGCPSIRVGIYVDHKGDIMIGAAVDRANIARNSIKDSYISSYKFFDEQMQINAEEKQYITSHLEQAMKEDWIEIYYQPIVRATNGRVCAEEALARWIDPEKGLLPPNKFIPILEDTNLIYKLDLHIVAKVLNKLKTQKEAGLFLVSQSVNLSRVDFETCDIVEEIRKLVDESGLPRDLITIEITESIIGSNFEYIQKQIDRFREMGFPIWIDDFGSGYSSLDMLQSIHVDLIKFDMSFIQRSDANDRSKIILTEMVKMTEGLGIDTICEGVETKEQVEFLREIGCAKLQGFYFAKPMPLANILERYEKGTQIGFENPEESAYFDAIDRINLYDINAIAKGDENDLKTYFNTIPMAIIEVRGEKARFARSNQAYRSFMDRIFGFDMSGMGGASFEDVPEGPGKPFVFMLRRCCAEGGKAFFEEKMPDGTVVHSFMRQVASNPVSDTMAAAVAVLAVNYPEDKKEEK